MRVASRHTTISAVQEGCEGLCVCICSHSQMRVQVPFGRCAMPCCAVLCRAICELCCAVLCDLRSMICCALTSAVCARYLLCCHTLKAWAASIAEATQNPNPAAGRKIGSKAGSCCAAPEKCIRSFDGRGSPQKRLFRWRHVASSNGVPGPDPLTFARSINLIHHPPGCQEAQHATWGSWLHSMLCGY